ncbi:MAG: TerB family tellurite resistance protein [Candidatus Polarisedimenticolia bacterium]
MTLLKRLGFVKDEDGPRDSSETETVRKIVRALERLEPERARSIAAFAYILGRVAHADRSISPRESREMERFVMELGHLPQEQAVLVVQMAKSQNELFGGSENYLVTREYNRLASREEKLALLECLFAVSAADDAVSSLEDGEIRTISKELRLGHGDFIAARVAWRDHLAVLRPAAKPAPRSRRE